MLYPIHLRRCNAAPGISLLELHKSLRLFLTPGMLVSSFHCQRNLPFSGEEVKAAYKTNQGCGVGGKISDSDSNSDLSKICDSDTGFQLRALTLT